MIDEHDIKQAQDQFQKDLEVGLAVAKDNDINLSNFKSEISKGLITTNDEDQWTWDYECYLTSICNGIFQTPSQWGEEFYQDRWRKQ